MIKIKMNFRCAPFQSPGTSLITELHPYFLRTEHPTLPLHYLLLPLRTFKSIFISEYLIKESLRECIILVLICRNLLLGNFIAFLARILFLELQNEGCGNIKHHE